MAKVWNINGQTCTDKNMSILYLSGDEFNPKIPHYKAMQLSRLNVLSSILPLEATKINLSLSTESKKDPDCVFPISHRDGQIVILNSKFDPQSWIDDQVAQLYGLQLAPGSTLNVWFG